jgi:hypothetical protein
MRSTTQAMGLVEQLPWREVNQHPAKDRWQPVMDASGTPPGLLISAANLLNTQGCAPAVDVSPRDARDRVRRHPKARHPERDLDVRHTLEAVSIPLGGGVGCWGANLSGVT